MQGTSGSPDARARAEIDHLVAALKSIAMDLCIIVVANRKAPTSPDFLPGDSFQTEYFSDEEIEQIIGAMRELNVFVVCYFSEDDFIKAVHAREIEALPRSLKLVYCAAQSGGGPGRKSLLPAFCRLHNLETLGSDAYVVGLARQKFHCALLMAALGLPVAETWCYTLEGEWLLGRRPPTGMKVINKLTYESASIGLDQSSVCLVDADLDERVRSLAVAFNQPITVQRFISGIEVEAPVFCAVSHHVPMLVGISISGRQALGDGFLTYDLVYSDHYGFYEFQGKEGERIAQTARDVATAIGIRGIGRVDFRVDGAAGIHVIDVATSPHIVRHSSIAFAFKSMGRPYPDVIATMAALACRREGWL
jgi:D-alanine-D-alanine ligase